MAYQHLMDYWAETLQDDCHLIAGDGWVEAARPQPMAEDKPKKAKPGLVVCRIRLLVDEVETLAAKVAAHLAKMGAY